MKTYERNIKILEMHDSKASRKGNATPSKFAPTPAVLKRQASQARDLIIAEEYKSGTSVRDLAQKFSAPESTIYSAIKRVRERQ